MGFWLVRTCRRERACLLLTIDDSHFHEFSFLSMESVRLLQVNRTLVKTVQKKKKLFVEGRKLIGAEPI